MASIHKSFGKWRVQIRRKGFPTLTEHFDTMEVSHIIGHKDLKMLKRYTHLKPINIANKINSFRDKS